MQYTNFVITVTRKKPIDLFYYKMMKKGSKAVLQYWLVDGKSWLEVQKIAIKLFSMATSSAVSERSFSTMGCIHTKLQNSLDVETIGKPKVDILTDLIFRLKQAIFSNILTQIISLSYIFWFFDLTIKFKIVKLFESIYQKKVLVLA